MHTGCHLETMDGIEPSSNLLQRPFTSPVSSSEDMRNSTKRVGEKESDNHGYNKKLFTHRLGKSTRGAKKSPKTKISKISNMEPESGIEPDLLFYSLIRTMTTKFCPKCQLDLDVSCFSKKGNGYGHKCKSCQNQYFKAHYEANKPQYFAKVSRYKAKVKEFIQQQKTENPCMDCGVFYHFSVMDFDHLQDKKFTISNTEHHSFPQILSELAKCELVCSNCHRLRTWKRLQSSQ